MEQWSNLINDLQFDVGDINPADYQTKAEVFQLIKTRYQGSGDNQLERVKRLLL